MSYKDDFPLLKHHPDLIYLDSAATSQKPKVVIDALQAFYEFANGSPHRGAHTLSIEATKIYQEGREKVQRFIGAERPEEIIFTKNATEALNLLAYGYVMKHLKSHHNIVLSITNHHSNILPFQRLCQQIGAELRYMYCDDNGHIAESEWMKIDDKTLMVSIPYISNGIGVKHNIKGIFDRAASFQVLKVLDIAQAVGHELIDVQALGADVVVFSGHKMYGPQGIGVLYGQYDVLDEFEPFLMGGDMIEYVEEQQATFAALPEKLEAGTQNVAGVLGLSVAIDYIEHIGLQKMIHHEKMLTNYAYDALTKLDFVTVYGDRERGALITFNVLDIHPHDVATLLDNRHIAIRAGHHCCQPLMKYLQQPSTCRISFSILNEEKDVDALIVALKEAKDVFYG